MNKKQSKYSLMGGGEEVWKICMESYQLIKDWIYCYYSREVSLKKEIYF